MAGMWDKAATDTRSVAHASLPPRSCWTAFRLESALWWCGDMPCFILCRCQLHFLWRPAGIPELGGSTRDIQVSWKASKRKRPTYTEAFVPCKLTVHPTAGTYDRLYPVHVGSRS